MAIALRIHAFEPFSRANGPGWRAVVWVQGCTIGCPSCFNPATHSTEAGRLVDSAEVFSWVMQAGPGIEGISVSGGEPFQQLAAVSDLTRRAKAANLSVLVFSGYTLEAIRSLPEAGACLETIDVLIAGPYVDGRFSGAGLRGSANQKIHLLSSRYSMAEVARVPPAEVIIHRDGARTATGIRPVGLWPKPAGFPFDKD